MFEVLARAQLTQTKDVTMNSQSPRVPQVRPLCLKGRKPRHNITELTAKLVDLLVSLFNAYQLGVRNRRCVCSQAQGVNCRSSCTFTAYSLSYGLVPMRICTTHLKRLLT